MRARNARKLSVRVEPGLLACSYGLFWGWQGRSKGSRFVIDRWFGPGGPLRQWADGAPHPLFLLCFYNKTTPFCTPLSVTVQSKLTQSRGIPPPDSPNR